MVTTRTLHKRQDIKQPRTDFHTRNLVDQAIASIATQGLRHAAAFLAAMGVPAHIAVRTLVYPHRRRC